MLAKYSYLGLGVAVLAASGFAAIQTKRLNTARADIAVLESQIGDKDSLIDMQTHAVAELQEVERARIVAMTEAGRRLEALTTDLAAERAKRRAATETDHALPACRTLLETDLAVACPAYSRGVRDAAQDRR